ncbi:MAG: sensor domain-containing diguanylate cyclase [Gemmatimonadota bacterium]
MRARLFLSGDPNVRPDGLERALIGSGYLLAEAGSPSDGGGPDVVLLTVSGGAAELEAALDELRNGPWRDLPVIAVMPGASGELVARALALGAADAIGGSVCLTEIVARVAARIRFHVESFRRDSASTAQAQLFSAFQDIALAARPEEALQTMVRRLADSLGVAHAACILAVEEGRGRAVAIADQPEVRNAEIDLADYPEAAHSFRSGRTVYVPNPSTHPLFAHPQWLAFQASRPSSAVAVPILFHGKVLGAVVLRTTDDRIGLSSDEVAFIETIARATSRVLEHEERRAGVYRRQSSAGVVDALTGCGGLDALDRRLREELQRAQRSGRRFAVCLLDIDGLRIFNQRLGIAGGDQILMELGGLLQRELRSPDFVARYGGDEFVLILPETDNFGAAQTLERLRFGIKAHPFPGLDPAGAPNLTAGIVSYPDPAVVHAEDLLALAEAALVTAKEPLAVVR